MKKNENVSNVLVSNVLVQQVIFGDILWVQGAGYNEFPLHGPPVDDLHYIYEILGSLETANELGVVSSANNYV